MPGAIGGVSCPRWPRHLIACCGCGIVDPWRVLILPLVALTYGINFLWIQLLSPLVTCWIHIAFALHRLWFFSCSLACLTLCLWYYASWWLDSQWCTNKVSSTFCWLSRTVSMKINCYFTHLSHLAFWLQRIRRSSVTLFVCIPCKVDGTRCAILWLLESRWPVLPYKSKVQTSAVPTSRRLPAHTT